MAAPSETRQPLPHPEELEQIEDPVARARAAYAAIDLYNQALNRASQVRRRAVSEVIADENRTLDEAGRLLGIHRQSVHRAITLPRPPTLADDPEFTAWALHGEAAPPTRSTVIEPFLRPGEAWDDPDARTRAQAKAANWLQRQDEIDRAVVTTPEITDWLHDASSPPRGGKARKWASRFLPPDGTWDDPAAAASAAAAVRRRFSDA